MNNDEVAAIAARLEAATPGPWEVWEPHRSDTDDMPAVDMTSKGGGYWHTFYADYGNIGDNISTRREAALPDATFIAHSHEDIAALLAERVILRESVKELLFDLKAFFEWKGLTWESAAMRRARALLEEGYNGDKTISGNA